MSINSRQKGARFERWVAKRLIFLFAYLAGIARRGCQFAGGQDSPDVIGWPGVHIETKHCNRMNLRAWWKQACRDAGTNIPVLIHKEDGGDVLITMRLDDVPPFFEIHDRMKKEAA